jgi:putative DNA primase/helicase
LKAPEIVKYATNKYRQDEDLISHFISDKCSLGDHKEVKAGQLYKTYKGWCDEMGHKPMTGTRFGKEMNKRFDSHKGREGKKYLEIGINNGDY